MLRKLPLIVILGSTGTGKTKLSIELAKRFNGEIISADSMQLYKGLSIATAKATPEEQSAAPHHLLDVATPGLSFNVLQFRDMALPIIDDLFNQSKIPIIVGGTNYYIESILWNILVGNANDASNDERKVIIKRKISSSENDSSDATADDDSFSTAGGCLSSVTKKLKTTSSMDENKVPTVDEILQMDIGHLDNTVSSEILHQYLKVVDPVTANRLHPNNKRKIVRALEVFITNNGTTLSTILDEQRNMPGGCNLGGPLRYQHVILFWLKCDQDVLNDRLDTRVDGMIEQGLLTEIRNFYNKNICDKSENDLTKGILQTIGFKEILPYLSKFNVNDDVEILNYLKNKNREEATQPPPTEPSGYNAILKCLDELKLVTRRYSKNQIKWVKHRLLCNKNRQVPNLYCLDTTRPKLWFKNVYQPAEDVIQSYINDVAPKLQPLTPHKNPREGLNEEVTNVCDLCQRVFIGEYQWEIHLKSNKHKKVMAKKRKRMEKHVKEN